jgi:hypothetical protein
VVIALFYLVPAQTTTELSVTLGSSAIHRHSLPNRAVERWHAWPNEAEAKRLPARKRTLPFGDAMLVS